MSRLGVMSALGVMSLGLMSLGVKSGHESYIIKVKLAHGEQTNKSHQQFKFSRIPIIGRGRNLGYHFLYLELFTQFDIKTLLKKLRQTIKFFSINTRDFEYAIL